MNVKSIDRKGNEATIVVEIDKDLMENGVNKAYMTEKERRAEKKAHKKRNRLKSRKRHESEELTDAIPTQEAESQNVLETVMSLSVKERTVIYLYYYEGYSAEEIGRILKITASAVRSRMERARKHLKLKLEGGAV